MGRRKHCSAQPYLDYIGVSEKERKEMNESMEKEELLAGLFLMKKRCPYSTFTWGGHTLKMDQAYAQLKDIVIKHFEGKEGKE